MAVRHHGFKRVVSVLIVVVLLSVATYSLKISFNEHMDTASHINLYRLSLLACVRQCVRITGYTQINYSKRHLNCECIPHNHSHSSVHLERRVGYINVNVADILMEKLEDIGAEVPAFCPVPFTDNAAVVYVLGNMNREGSKLVLRCPRCYEMEGMDTTICQSDRVWSKHGVCVKVCTMSTVCQTDDNCTDFRSACRDGRCWCKPGLSHNPDTSSCVEFCSDGYGNTFQILKEHGIHDFNLFIKQVDDMDSCMDFCLRHNSPDYVCIYADYEQHSGYCKLNKVPTQQVPRVSHYGFGDFLLQRDCKSSTE